MERKYDTNAGDSAFITARANYEQHRKQLHSNFIREKALCAKTDPKSFWQFINNKRKSNTSPAKIDFNSEVATTNGEKADIFAKFLNSVYVNHENDPDLHDFIKKRQEIHQFNILITSDIIHSILCKMELSKGSDQTASPLFF